MKQFGIAGVQMAPAASTANIEAMGKRLDGLMRLYPWVEMVVFSELATFGPVPALAQTLPGPAEAQFQEMAARHKIWLIPGSMYERAGDEIYNTASVIDPQGKVAARYRKMFPFYPYEQGIAAGDQFVVFDVAGVGRFGVCICYDMWFPETIRTLTAMGAEVILHPVLTNSIDRDIEVAMAQATAAQFQCFLFDINGLGVGGNGRSCVVDPHGRFLHQSSVNEEFIPVLIDLEQVRGAREQGVRGLGQTLKSFRDRQVEFGVYDRARFDGTYLESLGALVKPTRQGLTVSNDEE